MNSSVLLRAAWRRIVSFVGVAWCALLLPAWADRAKESTLEAPPPLPQTVGVQVFRGESVRIPLQARGRSAAEARFLLRSSPRLGQLGPVQPHRPGLALVEYTHRGGATDTVDSFTYAAQAPGTPVSAPAKVTVRIVDRPAELQHPEEVAFGDVLVGETARQYLYLQNSGGLPLRTQISVEPEWHLPRGTEIEIPPQSSVEWPVEFSPTADGDRLGVVRFSHNDRAVVRLTATGREPLRWTPLALEIRQDTAGPAAPEIELTNRTAEPLEVRVGVGEGLRGPEVVRLPPEAAVRVPFEVVPGTVRGARGEIVFTHPWGQAKVPYQLFPQPGEVVILPPDRVEFEPIAPQGEARAEVLLENRGGLPVPVSLESTTGVEIRGASSFSLAPGQTQKVELLFRGREPGEVQGQLVVRVGQEARTVAWRGFIGDERDRALALRGKVMNQPAGLREGAAAAADTPPPWASRPEAPGEKPAQPGLQPWTDLQLLTPMANSLVLEWKAPIKPGQDIQLQTRIWAVNENNEPQLTWVPLPNVDVFMPREGVVRATLYRLVPDTRLMLRYQVRGPTGRLEMDSEMVALSIPAKETGWRIPWFWLLVIGLAVLGGWAWRRRQAREKAEADAAVRRLESNR